jgi:CRP/FNR family transcriptional regulator, nitrogen oxide reductase regulator
MSSSRQASPEPDPPAPVSPQPGRRRIPLTSTCALPHRCSRAVRMQVLGGVALFTGLSQQQLEGIDKRMVSLSWAAGDPLFTAGELADHLYVLAAGQAKLSQPRPGGQEVVVDLLTPGDLFGALSILGQPVYPETAWALTTTCALRIDAQSFREILAEHPEVALRVLDDVAGRLAQARSDVGQQSTSTVAQRVATTLLRLADKLGQERSGNRGTLLQLPLSRADLAAMVGSTAESVSRVMSRLRKDGIIDSGRRWTAVLDRDRLAATADMDR